MVDAYFTLSYFLSYFFFFCLGSSDLIPHMFVCVCVSVHLCVSMCKCACMCVCVRTIKWYIISHLIEFFIIKCCKASVIFHQTDSNEAFISNRYSPSTLTSWIRIYASFWLFFWAFVHKIQSANTLIQGIKASHSTKRSETREREREQIVKHKAMQLSSSSQIKCNAPSTMTWRVCKENKVWGESKSFWIWKNKIRKVKVKSWVIKREKKMKRNKKKDRKK